jgi:general secretion pathway protein H
MRRARRGQQGFTLLEIAVVIVVISVAMGAAGFGLGALTRTELKSACHKIISASRYAYNRAVIHGTTVRVSFALPGETISIEESHGQITLARPDDPTRVEIEEDEEGTGRGADVDPWKAAQARLQETFTPSLGASSFGPIGGGKLGARFSDIPLGRNVRIVRLIAAHEPEPRENGKGAIYFFPGGQTEHAVVQIAQGDDHVYSVEIHPLTGRGKVHTEAYEPTVLLGDPRDREASEVDGL